MIASAVAGSISDGVPPPKKMEPRRRSGSSAASWARSAKSASRHSSWSIEARTWLLKSQYGHLLTQNGQWTYKANGCAVRAPFISGWIARSAMMRPALTVLALAIPAAAFGLPQTGVLPWTDKSPKSRNPLVLRSTMIAAHNEARRQYGVPALAWDDALARDAAVYAVTLARTNRFEHDAAERSDLKSRAKICGWVLAAPTAMVK